MKSDKYPIIIDRKTYFVETTMSNEPAIFKCIGERPAGGFDAGEPAFVHLTETGDKKGSSANMVLIGSQPGRIIIAATLPDPGKRWLNEERFTYLARNGSLFNCARCDLRDPVIVTFPHGKISAKRQAQDISEMVAHHVLFIHPNLNGFPGYDMVDFQFV